jgi:Transposase DDE domain
MLYLLRTNQEIILEGIKCQIKGILKELAQWLKTNLYANIIKLLNNIISSNQFINQHRLYPTAFTRNRSLPFKSVIVFLVNLLKSSIQNELDKFFKIINHSELPERVVTSSAFTQARKKLSHKAFIELNQAQVKYFYDNVNYNRWHGFRLAAIDGSTLILPKNEQTIKEFGQYSHSRKTTPVVMARASQFYDVLNRVTIGSVLSPLSTGELDLAIEHIRAADKKDLLLFDRGYNAFWLFNMVVSQGLNFCARINTDCWKAAQELISSGLREGIYKIYPTKKSEEKSKQLGLPIEPIELRFICIDMANGDKEVLATSLLDLNKYPYELFADLYHSRWIIEESYKIMKSRIEMENFTGKSPEAVKQDFYARIFTANLTAILSYPVHNKIKDKQNKKYDYQINWTQAIAKMKDSIVLLFFDHNIERIIKVMQEHFLRNTVPIRPNRVFPRIFRPKKHYYMTYKPI